MFALTALLVACLVAAAPHRRMAHAPPQSWGNDPVRGVNIGGW
jgi:hypothetical protein